MIDLLSWSWILIAIGSLVLTGLMRPQNFLITLLINFFVCFIAFNIIVGSGVFNEMGINLSTINISQIVDIPHIEKEDTAKLENMSFHNFSQPIVANMTTKFKTAEEYFGSVFK